MTRSARPVGFFASIVTRSVPFALFFAAFAWAITWMDIVGVALAIRLATAGIIMGWGIKDGEGVRSLALLPLRMS